ncbi:MAG: hypothetical protein GY925_08090 [Actinomycetia bacterium]|nr:hypothetical protein [Actinomycetes bacterium]
MLGHVRQDRTGVGPTRRRPADVFAHGGKTSRETHATVDGETCRIIDECNAVALATLKANRRMLNRLAEALLEHETLE